MAVFFPAHSESKSALRMSPAMEGLKRSRRQHDPRAAEMEISWLSIGVSRANEG